MPTLELVNGGDGDRGGDPCVAVLLPGMLDSAATFKRRGFGDLAAEKAPGLGVVATDAHFGYYRKNLILTRLQEDVVGPRLADRQDVWLVGTSLGGIGSLLYARGKNGDADLPDADRIAGLVLLAPFLGEEELIAEIEGAGGPKAWQPPEEPRGEPGSREAVGDAAWIWLLDWSARDVSERPRIVLGWGDEDDLAPAARLAAQLLPPEDVFERPGDHDWKTWRQVWSDILDAGLFEYCAGP